ncbi:MAG: FecR domain-containing protein, partial [Candidatus Aureabacteria bacterium]|nr:FecR domain-containing protein [Candidatus Auribacterota bacterium]
TADNSYADMELGQKNRFRLKENSQLAIDRILAESKEPNGAVVRLTDLGLLKGEVLARLDNLPSGSRLTLKSPVAVAAVRGTAFSFCQQEGARTASLAVSRGSVGVQAAGEPDKSVTVKGQQQTVVAPWGMAMIRAKGTGLPPRELLIKRLDDPSIPFKDAQGLLARLKNPQPSFERIVIGTQGTAVSPASMSDADAERWATVEARYRAQKGIIDKLETVRLSGDETVGDLMNKDQKVCEAILTSTGEAAVIKTEYDRQSKTATVRMEYPLEKTKAIIKRDIALVWKEITPISLTEYGAAFGPFIRATTERAATVDGYRRLAEKIYGTVVNTSTTLQNLAVQNDQVQIAVKGVVQGAEEASKTYYSDGSIDVVLEARGAAVKKAVAPVAGPVLGQHYMASPAAIGADDFIRLLSLDQI